MDSKLLLIKVITLLFLESQLENPSDHAKAIAKLALEEIRPTNQALLADFSRDAIGKLLDLTNWMISRPVKEVFNKEDILSRVKMATETEEYIYDALASAIEGLKTEEENKGIVKASREYINQHLRQAAIIKVMKDGYTQVQYKSDSVDWTNFVADFMTQLEPYKTADMGDSHSLVESVDMSNPDALAAAFAAAKESVSTEGIIRFGWQGLNRMFGDQGGARRGEMIVIGALQHSFKSGTSLEMLKSAAIYNTPYMINPAKKPLLLRLSFENPVANDIIHIYRSLVEPEIDCKIDQSSLDPLTAAAYVHEKLTATGYTVKVEHFDPSDFTIFDLAKVVEKYEELGFEIHMLNIDYLAMMSTKGCKQGATGQDIRDLFRRTRNLTSTRNILCITPAQLSTEAKKLTRNGVEDFVKEIANKGYYDSCSTIDQEVDMEIYQHKVEVNGEAYLTIQRGKHRKSGAMTHAADLHTVYKFNKERGFIDDDVLGLNMSLARVAAAPRSEGGAPAWFDI